MPSQRVGTNSLISVRAGLAGQSKHMTKPPEAAIGSCGALQESSPRTKERRGQSARFGIVSTCNEAVAEDSMACPCKAHSALQNPLHAPQTRGTATALVVAQSGKQNPKYANALWPACPAS